MGRPFCRAHRSIHAVWNAHIHSRVVIAVPFRSGSKHILHRGAGSSGGRFSELLAAELADAWGSVRAQRCNACTRYCVSSSSARSASASAACSSSKRCARSSFVADSRSFSSYPVICKSGCGASLCRRSAQQCGFARTQVRAQHFQTQGSLPTRLEIAPKGDFQAPAI